MRLRLTAGRTVTIATAVGLIGALPAVALTAARASTPATDFSTSLGANRIAMDVAERLTSALENEPDYAGIMIAPGGVKLMVTDGTSATITSAIAAAVAQTPIAVPVEVTTVRNSKSTMDALSAKVADDAAWQKAEALDVSWWGADTPSNKFRIGLLEYTDAKASLLTSRYGPDVTVIKATPIHVADSPSRDNDTAANGGFFGGDRVRFPGYDCSSWFPINSSTYGKIIPTAAHCSNGAATTVTLGATGGLSVVAYQFGGNSDVQGIRATGQGYVWSDSKTDTGYPAYRGVGYAAATSDPYGGIVAADGYNNGEQNNLTIHGAVSQTYMDEFGHSATVDPLVTLTWSTPTRQVGAGDSGGPIFSIDSAGRVKPYGEFVAYDASTLYYVPARTVLAHFGSGSSVILCGC